MTFGISAAGFLRMRESDIKTALEDAVVAEFGVVNLGPDSVFGQLIGVFAAQLAEAWEALEATYHSQFPASAESVALDNVVSLNGVTRIPAAPTKVIVSLRGTEGTVVPATTSKVSVSTTKKVFVAQAGKTISRAEVLKATVSVPTVANSTLYRVTIEGSNCDFTSDASATTLEIIAGLVLAINNNTTVNTKVTATDVLDGTLYVLSDDLSVAFSIDVDPQLPDGSERLALSLLHTPQIYECTEDGPVLALTGKVDTIDTPITGWTSVTNLKDGTLGRIAETDTELRIRRLLALRTGGKSTLEAILGALLTEVTGVTRAKVYENRTDSTDADGRPPHSFEAVVSGGTDADVAKKIWDNKPAGIQMFGSTTSVVKDTNGNDQTVNFNRPTAISIYVRVEVTTYAEETLPTNWVELIAAEVLAFGKTHTIGKDVILQRFLGPIFKTAGIAVADVFIKVGSAPAGTIDVDQDNLAIAARQIASFDSANIVVTTSP